MIMESSPPKSVMRPLIGVVANIRSLGFPCSNRVYRVGSRPRIALPDPYVRTDVRTYVESSYVEDRSCVSNARPRAGKEIPVMAGEGLRSARPRTVPRKGDRVRITTRDRFDGREGLVVVADHGGETGVDLSGSITWFLRRELIVL